MIYGCALCHKLGHEAKDCKSFQFPERTYTRSELGAAKAPLEIRIQELQSVCAEAYQLAGALNAPIKALDNLSAAASGKPLPHSTFLPVTSSPLEAEIKRLRDGIRICVDTFRNNHLECPCIIKLESLLTEPTVEKCGQPADSFIPRWGMSFACVLPKGHSGDHMRGGTCFKHGEYIGKRCSQWPNCIAEPPTEQTAGHNPPTEERP